PWHMWHRETILRMFFRDHKGMVIKTLSVSFFAALFMIALPLAIGKYYDHIFTLHSFKARILDFLPFDLDKMPVFLAFFCGLVVLGTLFSFAERYCVGVLGEHFVFQIRKLLFEHQ